MPDLLSPAELLDLRQTIVDLTMPGTAITLRGTVTVYSDSGGYKSVAGTVMAGTVPSYAPCRYRPSSAREKQEAGRAVTEIVWTLVFPAEWDVRQTDRLQILGAPRIFDVQQILAPMTYEMQRKVICTSRT